MRGNCAPVAMSDIHRDVLINFLSRFKFLMGVALLLIRMYDCTPALI